MEAQKRTIEHYISPNGRNPFRNWFERLRDRKAQGIILERLRRIEHHGNFGNCGPIGNGLQELKIDFGPGYRVYFGLDGDVIVLLLGGGDKSTQQRDIARAIKRWE